MLQVSTPGLHMKLVVTDYTLDPAQAKAETAVDPTGLIAFARLAPDAQSRPDLQQPPRGRSRSHNRQQQSLQARLMLARAFEAFRDVCARAQLVDLKPTENSSMALCV